MKYQRMPLAVSLLLRYLHQEKKEPLTRLVQMYPQYKRTTIFRHMKKPMADIHTTTAENHNRKKAGRPRKATDRDMRKILSALRRLYDEAGDFTVTDIQREAGISENYLSRRTIRRYLNKMGYRFRQCRKKGILVKEDLVKRLKFAKKCKSLPQSFWKEGVSFYLDGVSFVHKTNPAKHARTSRTRTWMKKGDSLKRHCTAKGKKEGVNGRVAKFMCAIAYGHGFIKCQQIVGKVDGEQCREFVKDHFPSMFENSSNPRGKLFLQDGDPAQNSALAREAMESVGCRLFKIPARSPDLNPIENSFHSIRKKILKDSIERGLERESYQEFCRRVKNIIMNFSTEIIDRTIDSMNKRIDTVIANKGLRLKY